MLHPLLFHLLGDCLLLSQLPGELFAQESKTVKLYGRELARAQIEICGQIKWDIASSSINKDTEILNTMSEFIPNFQGEVTSNEELREIIQKRQSEAEDNSPSELKNLGLDKHS